MAEKIKKPELSEEQMDKVAGGNDQTETGEASGILSKYDILWELIGAPDQTPHDPPGTTNPYSGSSSIDTLER